MNTFATEDLPFAAFLCSVRKLDFLRCERNERGRISFIFEDPDQRGHQHYLEYQSGGLIPAIGFYACVKFLRQRMDSLSGGRRREHEHEQRTAYAGN